jgi:hypothetical protein
MIKPIFAPLVCRRFCGRTRKLNYRFVLTDSRAKALVVSEAIYPKFANLIGLAPELMHVIVSGENAGGHRRFQQTRVRNLMPRRRRGTIFASASTPQARLGGPRPRCMSIQFATDHRTASWRRPPTRLCVTSMPRGRRDLLTTGPGPDAANRLWEGHDGLAGWTSSGLSGTFQRERLQHQR